MDVVAASRSEGNGVDWSESARPRTFTIVVAQRLKQIETGNAYEATTTEPLIGFIELSDEFALVCAPFPHFTSNTRVRLSTAAVGAEQRGWLGS
jgi:hypothetical protein